MISNFRKLFEKALIGELEEPEIEEFNFLSSALQASDSYMSKLDNTLFYDDVKRLVKIYEKTLLLGDLLNSPMILNW